MSQRVASPAEIFPARRDERGYLCALPFCGERLTGRRRRYCCEGHSREAYLRSGDVGEMRRQVLARDRGICAECGIDCLAVAAALAPLSRAPYQATSARGAVNVDGWIGRAPATGRWRSWSELADHVARLAMRRARLKGEEPRWWNVRRQITDHPGYAREHRTQLTEIVARLRRAFLGRRDALGWASAGHTWEVDHIVPVAIDGGRDLIERGLPALRTLCLPCHRKRNTRQAAERARRRHQKRYRRLRAQQYAAGEQMTLEAP